MDSIFGLNRPASLSGMRLLVTVHNDAELALYSSILEGEQIPYLSKDRGSGGAVRVIAGYSIFGIDLLVPEERFDEAVAVLDAYRNGAAAECDDGTESEE